MRLAVLSSHGGTNLTAIREAIEDGRLKAEIGAIVCNNPSSRTVRLGFRWKIPTYVFNRTSHPDAADRDRAILSALRRHGIDLVVLAGYNCLLGEESVRSFPNRALNFHPAPIDSNNPPGPYAGKGMYGEHAHAKVLRDGLSKTAVTIHVVDEQYDHGPIVMTSSVPVRKGDTPDALGERVYEAARWVYWRAIRIHLARLERRSGVPVNHAAEGSASSPRGYPSDGSNSPPTPRRRHIVVRFP